MRERLETPQPRQLRAVDRFSAYTVLTSLAALAGLFALAEMRSWDIDRPALFAILAAFVLAGELLPIPVPRRNGLTEVTISTAFAFALLLRFGAGPATLVYVASAVVADLRDRTALIKVLFNAAQYALAMEAATAVLSLLGPAPPVTITGPELPVILASAAAFFAANHLLACTGGALLADLPIVRYQLDDLFFQTWTGGCLLAFA